ACPAGAPPLPNFPPFALMAEPVDAILVTASGCGTTLKDYGFMLRSDSDCASEAARVSGLTMDICEYFSQARLIAAAAPNGISVAYHAACSLQHGQKITRQPKELPCKLRFAVKDVAEGHLRCGSAGTYNILQPDIRQEVRTR